MNIYKTALALLLLTFCINSSALADSPAKEDDLNRTAVESSEDDEGSFIGGVLLYLPNRIMDVFDIFRLRVRVGPGVAAGVRVTKVAQLYLGTYATVFAGLPGPRLSPSIPIPAGLESYNGAAVSLAEATVDGGIGPDYSSTEIGFGVQLGIIGFDFGVDPVEVADLAAGVLTIDLREDDL